MKGFMESIRRFFVKHADIDNSQSLCRDAYGNLREYCKLEHIDR